MTWMIRFLVTLFAVSLAQPALALRIGVKVLEPATGPVYEGVASVTPNQGQQSVTFQVDLEAETSINGYDLTIGWDPQELSFASASQLFPDFLPPDTFPFTVPPDPNEPDGTRIAAIQLTGFATTALFNVTFDILDVVRDGLADFWWLADAQTNGCGLSPGDLCPFENPAGSGISMVPEPGTLLLLGAGLIGLAHSRRRE